MLTEPQRTPFDLSFKLAGTPVRVSPFFWLVLVVFGSDFFRRDFLVGLIWVAVGFVSLLAHEFGHVSAMWRLTRSPARVVLHAFGGLAIPTYVTPHPWRRFFIAAAGPAAGFLLTAVVWVSELTFGWAVEAYPKAVYDLALMVGIGWNVMSLLPVWPFDGSRMLREVFVVTRRRRPDNLTQRVSVAVAGFIAGYGLLLELGTVPVEVMRHVPWWLTVGRFGIILFALLAVQSYLMLRQYDRGPRLFVDDDDDTPPWKRRVR